MSASLDKMITAAVEATSMPVGTHVIKTSGYPFPGEVRSVFRTKSGAVRFVVEATGEEYAGMLHIFNADQISPTPPEG